MTCARQGPREHDFTHWSLRESFSFFMGYDVAVKKPVATDGDLPPIKEEDISVESNDGTVAINLPDIKRGDSSNTASFSDSDKVRIESKKDAEVPVAHEPEVVESEDSVSIHLGDDVAEPSLLDEPEGPPTIEEPLIVVDPQPEEDKSKVASSSAAADPRHLELLQQVEDLEREFDNVLSSNKNVNI
jgi:hypothetical protein